MKVPLAPLWARYADELADSDHVELFPIRGTPGMAALQFVTRDDLPPGVVTDDTTTAETLRAWQARTSELSDRLEPFEYRHHVIARLLLVNLPVPRTAKGTVSRHRILVDHRAAIAALTDPATTDHPSVLDIRPGLG